MYRKYLLLIAGVLCLYLPGQLHAALPSDKQPLENFDARLVQIATPSAAVANAAVGQLRARVPNAKVEFAPITRSPKIVFNPNGFLTGPGGNGRGVSAASLTAIPANDSNRVTKAFIREHSALFGHGPEALDAARVKREFVTPHNGMRTVVWEQQVQGVPVFEGVLISHVTSNDELVNISSHFIPDPAQAAARGGGNAAGLLYATPISASDAANIAARNVGENSQVDGIVATDEPAAAPEKNQKFRAGVFVGEAEAKLIWLPMDRDTLRLCWDVEFTSRSRDEMFRVLVDAQTGEVQVRHCLTEYISDATYRVFTSDSPSPFSPGNATPSSFQPPLVSRTLVTLPALDTTASPAGWISDGGNETVGNNVDAHTDINADDLPDLPRPQGSPSRVFDFAMDLTAQNPSGYTQAAVVQLFYWNNFMHDKLYELGFTEAAGNFQSNNFGRGGLGNDAVQADAQDGSGVNNANFSTPSDGSPGRMQMYVFNYPSPQRDGDLDAEIVLHEYTHGLSNRRVGGGVGISALQPRGMGEGWSDFYALSLLSEAGDDPNAVYAAGGYATYQLSGLTQNYYFGIRRYPYCTDMSKNPLTFKDIDPAQASAHSGIPRSPIIGTTANEVHNMGEVWCVTLWDARANLIAKYGWAVGNELMLQLVTDGMNLSPADPNFLQARDAILQADMVDTGGANQNELWAAFAKRGMGLSATSPVSSTTTGVVEAYDIPDDLHITPGVLTAKGPVGGPFTPNPAFYGVTNSGTASLNWSAGTSASWLTISPSNGTLAAASGVAVSITISATATNFPLGTTNAIITFTNQTSGVSQARTFTLNVVGRTLFEDFEPNIHFSVWSAFGGTIGSTVIATNYGGSVSGVNSLWFGDNGSRFATTIPVDTTAGGTTSFYLRFGNTASAPWETVDLPSEGVVLECSTNNGASWTLLGTYDTATFYNWTQVTLALPASAKSFSTQFRWRQLSHSGSCCDHWALDDINIDAGANPPTITVQPFGRTVKPGTNVSFTVSAQGSLPLIYRWRKNGTNLSNGGTITGATNSTLNISSVGVGDNGDYSVFITNNYGSIISSNAALNVTPLDHFRWSVVDSPQFAGQSFPITLIARDAAENTVTNFSGIVNLSATTKAVEFYRANFDDGLQGFTISNSFGLGGGLWHLSTGRAAQTGHSASNSIYFGTGEGPGGGGTYDTGLAAEGVIISPVIDLSSATGALALSFNCLIQSEPGSSWDHAIVEVSTNNGVSYAVLASNNQGGTVFGTDSGGSWISVSTDFSAFAGKQVLLRFHFNTVDNVANSYEGWYVDDIAITGSSAPLPVSPTTTGNFTNGVCAGSIAVQAAGSQVVLKADDGSGNMGLSNPFDVELLNDLAISVADSPDPVSAGSNLVYSITVTNTGPLDATSVVVTNTLPGTVALVSAIPSQGSCTPVGNVVTCDLGTITGGTNATIMITVTPNLAGTTLTNVANLFRGEADADLLNNTATALTTVNNPQISIADVSIPEGNVGTNNMTFAVTLNAPSAKTVSVNYATANGSALAGSDYASTNGILTFASGVTNQNVTVRVFGDVAIEPDETFFVNLSSPVNASLARTQATGMITNDDGLPGNIDHVIWSSISSPQYTNLPFAVTLSALDSFGNLATNFNGTVNFSGSPIVTLSPAISTAFTNGLWSGTIAVLNRATNLTLTANDGDGHTGSSNPFDVTPANMAPVILTQPTNQTVLAGGNATFVVAADGTIPLRFQWFSNTTNIPNATNASLTLTNIQSSDAGPYAVLVTNNVGGILSSNAVLTVNLPPPCAPLPFGAVAWWRAESNALDIINGNNGSLQGGMTFGVGESGTAFQFDGVDDYVFVPSNSTMNVVSSSGLTVECWIKPADTNIARPLVVWTTNNPATNVSLLSGPIVNTANGHYYYLIPSMTWTNAAGVGQILGGYLASITDSNESAWVLTNILIPNPSLNPWIGLYAANFAGPWAWLNGEPFVYSNWYPGEPNGVGAPPYGGNLYPASFGVNGGKWNDTPRADTYTGIIEANSGLDFWMSVEKAGSLYANILDNTNGSHVIVSAGGILRSNNYQHVALTYDHNTGAAQLFYNGSSVVNTNIGIFVPKTSGNLLLGKPLPNVSGNVLFKGGMDEVGIYQRALSTSEIQAIYNAGIGGKCAQAPIFLTQPLNQIVPSGSNVSFSTAVTSSVPVIYQWQKNGTNLNNGGRVNGITNTSLSISNSIVGDSGQYAVMASNVFGATFSTNATLLVFDLHHFAWNAIISPRLTNLPFTVTITAQDTTNGIATNFTGTVALSSTNGIPVTPSLSGQFVQGAWTGPLKIAQTTSNLVLVATDNLGHTGIANPINIVTVPGLQIQFTNNTLSLLWPAGSGFGLEASPSLSPANWMSVPDLPTQVGNQFIVNLPADGTNEFYRLRFDNP